MCVLLSFLPPPSLLSPRYVELLVDGEAGWFADYRDPNIGGFDRGGAAQSVPYNYRATGKCTETMERVVWDVSKFRGQTAMIRVVDASTVLWAHINVDDFQFDWDMAGASTSNAGGEESCASGQCGRHFGAMSGAAYTFRRHLATSVTIDGKLRHNPCSKYVHVRGLFTVRHG